MPTSAFHVNMSTPRSLSRGWVLVHKAGILQHVGPLAAGSGMAMLQVLTEVVCAVKLLGRVALPKLVHLLEVTDALFPILVSGSFLHGTPVARAGRRAGAGEFVSTVAAGISLARAVGGLVEGTVVARQRRARPRMTSHMQRILVAFSLILILEAVAAKVALILLLSLMSCELIRRLKLLGLLGAALAHVEALEFCDGALGNVGNLARAGSRETPGVHGCASGNRTSGAGVHRD